MAIYVSMGNECWPVNMVSNEERILKRLEAFHNSLNNLKQIADKEWHQGGITWKFDFHKIGAVNLTNTLTEVCSRSKFDLSKSFEQCVSEWAILMWYAHGCPPDQTQTAYCGDLTIRPKDVKVFNKEAVNILRMVGPVNGTEKCIFGIEIREIDYISIKIAFALRRQVMVHHILWSVD